jgi:pimeloyl-ACP methyl ester carboxylesterase
MSTSVYDNGRSQGNRPGPALDNLNKVTSRQPSCQQESVIDLAPSVRRVQLIGRRFMVDSGSGNVEQIIWPDEGQMALTDQTTKLADGRVLGYAEFGDPSGTPVLFFHGFPASRLEGSALDVASRKVRVRLIVPDRPGFGLSEPKRRRSFLDWPADISGLAGHLGLYEFSVLATSGGTPYAIACALRIPEHLASVGIVSAMSPLRDREVQLSMRPDQRTIYTRISRFPMLARRVLSRSMQEVQTDFPAVMTRMMADRPDADKSVLERPDFQEMFRASLTEAFRQGVAGAVQELGLWHGSWRFPWQDIRHQVRIWQGRKDVITPPIMAEKLVSLLPQTLTRWYPDEGHSLLFARSEEILRQLTA